MLAIYNTLKHAPKNLRFYYRGLKQGVPISAQPLFCSSDAIEHFKKRLHECENYHEWGGGGSTILADTVDKPGITAESDKSFVDSLLTRMKSNSKRNVEYVNLGVTGKGGSPVFPHKTQQKGFSYCHAVLDECDFSKKNLFLIDGRFRRLCLLSLLHSFLATETAKKDQKVLFDDYFRERQNCIYSAEYFLAPSRRIGYMAEFHFAQNIASHMPPSKDLMKAAKDFR